MGLCLGFRGLGVGCCFLEGVCVWGFRGFGLRIQGAEDPKTPGLYIPFRHSLWDPFPHVFAMCRGLRSYHALNAETSSCRATQSQCQVAPRHGQNVVSSPLLARVVLHLQLESLCLVDFPSSRGLVLRCQVKHVGPSNLGPELGKAFHCILVRRSRGPADIRPQLVARITRSVHIGGEVGGLVRCHQPLNP